MRRAARSARRPAARRAGHRARRPRGGVAADRRAASSSLQCALPRQRAGVQERSARTAGALEGEAAGAGGGGGGAAAVPLASSWQVRPPPAICRPTSCRNSVHPASAVSAWECVNTVTTLRIASSQCTPLSSHTRKPRQSRRPGARSPAVTLAHDAELAEPDASADLPAWGASPPRVRRRSHPLARAVSRCKAERGCQRRRLRQEQQASCESRRQQEAGSVGHDQAAPCGSATSACETWKGASGRQHAQVRCFRQRVRVVGRARRLVRSRGARRPLRSRHRHHVAHASCRFTATAAELAKGSWIEVLDDVQGAFDAAGKARVKACVRGTQRLPARSTWGTERWV